MFILGLQGSPRKKGNTDIWLDTFMQKAAARGAGVQTIQTARAGVVPCKGCGYCETHGHCVIQDDPMSLEIFGLLRRADLVVAASPVYFYGVSGQLKILMDRCQTLWSRKYRFKLKDPLAATRKGLLFSVAASTGKQLFDGVELTTAYFFDAIDASDDHRLTYRGVEERGAIRNHEGWEADIEQLVENVVRPLCDRTSVLFVSPKGACRAPLAAALAQHRYGESIRCDYAGLAPAPTIQPNMISHLEKQGLDLAYYRPQGLDQAFGGRSPDLTVFIGQGSDVAGSPPPVDLHWPLAPVADEDETRMTELYRQMAQRLQQPPIV